MISPYFLGMTVPEASQARLKGKTTRDVRGCWAIVGEVSAGQNSGKLLQENHQIMSPNPMRTQRISGFSSIFKSKSENEIILACADTAEVDHSAASM